MKQDQQDGNQLAKFYRDALVMISAHLTTFYNNYATETGLTLTQVDQEVSQWDLEQFKLAVDAMVNDPNPDDTLAKRLKLAYAQASISRRNMLGAMVGIGLAVASDQADRFGQQTITNSYHKTYHARTAKPVTDIKPMLKPIKDYTSRIWLHNDQMANRVQQVLYRGLQRGLTKQDWQQLTAFKYPSQPREPDNLASEANKVITQEQTLLKSTKADSDNQATLNGYKAIGGYAVEMVLQPGHCDPCAELASEGPWLIDDAPNIPEDTHPGCRCSFIMVNNNDHLESSLHDDTGNLSLA
ncbi:hypothetical protein [Lactobacillus kunkeei] [Lactiplantibacillus mudanjiangensis]|nr:hypothetical protein [Lactobacillus kunkeei] [Lactiplantibacillus mudanjiangensis]